MKTAIVQVGAKSPNGSTSTRNVGRNNGLHPIRLTSTTQTTTSSTSFKADAKPSTKRGKSASCNVSATIATARAIQIARREGARPSWVMLIQGAFKIFLCYSFSAPGRYVIQHFGSGKRTQVG